MKDSQIADESNEWNFISWMRTRASINCVRCNKRKQTDEMVRPIELKCHDIIEDAFSSADICLVLKWKRQKLSWKTLKTCAYIRLFTFISLVVCQWRFFPLKKKKMLLILSQRLKERMRDKCPRAARFKQQQEKTTNQNGKYLGQYINECEFVECW